MRAMKPPEAHDEATIVRRLRVSSLTRFLPRRAPAGVRIEPLAGVALRGEWLCRDAPPPDRAVLYLHGGGYVSGSPLTHRRMTVMLARRAGARVLALDYRLAPEHRFPAALDDAVCAYEHLLHIGETPDRIDIAGDSAGGGLALALLVALRQRGRPMPAGCVAMSPWVDLAASSPSIRSNSRTDVMFHGGGMASAARVYLGDADARNPLASPMYADFADFPPLQIFVSNSEVLRDEAVAVAERAVAAGVPVELHAWDDLPHVWLLGMGYVPEADRAVEILLRFIRGAGQTASPA